MNDFKHFNDGVFGDLIVYDLYHFVISTLRSLYELPEVSVEKKFDLIC